MIIANPLLLSNHADFQIELQQDQVLLYGSPEESAGVLLRGNVILTCFEQTKVKSIRLKFAGIAQVSWIEGNGSKSIRHKEERIIIEKEWTFIEFKKKAHHFTPGQHKWAFEVPLPGNLPISVNHSLGRVEYSLKAYCDRPAFSSNYMACRTFKLSRMIFPFHTDLNDSVVISNTWAGKVNYDISIPSKFYSPDTTIPVAIDLEPIAYQLTVKSVCLTLKEYITGHVLGSHKTQGKKLRRMRDSQLVSSGDGHWIKTIHLPIPQILNFDMNSELIQVKHKITLTIALENFDGHISELKAAIPVTIAPPVEEDDNLLPAYEENRRSYSQLPSYSSPLNPSDARYHSDVLPTYESAITA